MTIKYTILLIALQSLAFATYAQNTTVNSSPTLDPVEDLTVKSNADTRYVTLTGITPGDEPEQLTQVSVSTNNGDMIDWLEVDQTSNGRAYIRYRLRPDASGSANVRVLVTDNGNPAREISRTFSITVMPATVYSSPEKSVPADLALKKMTLKAYPNPFVSNATIVFSTPSDERQTTVDVYNMSGAKVGTLFNNSTIGGKSYSIHFGNTGLQPGIYIIRLNSPHHNEQLKLVLGQ
ncbi:T9SS type A sorting domain-containing protein [Chitinophaga filiformis]|uniref:T9SS type A sorting domain-containing protein n=1 Tax=Chitinophaga filiformis TaxID=104663 RepID=UPI001F1F92B1|nr:T9SS type A sorting domain-containing protein [Chitinophaga filiformis]MCF6403111.1 T9SS type A sorting domain-containing protein [Chitinophaga filiformis]